MLTIEKPVIAVEDPPSSRRITRLQSLRQQRFSAYFSNAFGDRNVAETAKMLGKQSRTIYDLLDGDRLPGDDLLDSVCALFKLNRFYAHYLVGRWPDELRGLPERSFMEIFVRRTTTTGCFGTFLFCDYFGVRTEGLSNVEIARRVDKSPTGIRDINTGNRLPGPELLDILCAEFGLNRFYSYYLCGRWPQDLEGMSETDFTAQFGFGVEGGIPTKS